MAAHQNLHGKKNPKDYTNHTAFLAQTKTTPASSRAHTWACRRAGDKTEEAEPRGASSGGGGAGGCRTVERKLAPAISRRRFAQPTARSPRAEPELSSGRGLVGRRGAAGVAKTRGQGKSRIRRRIACVGVSRLHHTLRSRHITTIHERWPPWPSADCFPPFHVDTGPENAKLTWRPRLHLHDRRFSSPLALATLVMQEQTEAFFTTSSSIPK